MCTKCNYLIIKIAKIQQQTPIPMKQLKPRLQIMIILIILFRVFIHFKKKILIMNTEKN